MLQVIGLPFIFIPISTLNYVGVPATKSNQISSLSNFARNMGGSAGTALLTTYLARSSQVHQVSAGGECGAGQRGLSRLYRRMTQMLCSGGMPAAAAGQVALGEAYREMVRQASMLSYQNAFAILVAGGAAAVAAALPDAPAHQARETRAGRTCRALRLGMPSLRLVRRKAIRTAIRIVLERMAFINGVREITDGSRG